MALGRYSKGASAQQGRYKLSRIFEDLFQSDVPDGNYGGYYDILIENGTQNVSGQPVFGQGSQVHRLVQLVPGASGSDLTYISINENPSFLEWRNDIVWETGNATPDNPVLFYPESALVQADPETPLYLNQNELRQGVINWNIPPGVNVYEYTLAMVGARGLHKIIPDAQARADFFAQLGPEAENALFPTSPEPGATLIGIRYELDLPNDQIIINRLVFVDGVDVSPPPTFESLLDEFGQPVPFDPNVGSELVDQFAIMLGMPCWALQKLLLITRMVTPEEAQKISNRMMRTMRSTA
jgi:hypothetical protein